MNISKSYFKGIKGKISILFVEKGNALNVYLINKEKKICIDFFNFLLDSYDPYSEAEKILKGGLSFKKIDLETMNLKNHKDSSKNINEKIFNKNLLKSLNNIDKKVNFSCKKFYLKGNLKITNFSLFSLSKNEIKYPNFFSVKYESFNDYLNKKTNLNKKKNKTLNNYNNENSELIVKNSKNIHNKFIYDINNNLLNNYLTSTKNNIKNSNEKEITFILFKLDLLVEDF